MPSCESSVVDYSGKKLSEEDIQECVKQLRELMDADRKFQTFRKDDAYLLRFLHCTDFSVHQAYRRIDDYCNLMRENSEWFACDSPLENKDLIEEDSRAVLPDVRDKDGRRIYISRIGKIDASRVTPQQVAKVDEYWLELILDEPETQAAGLSIVMDMKGYSWSMFRWMTPSNMRIGSKKADLYPCKELVYHIVNTSALLNATVKIVWPFLTAKLKEKFHFHFDDWESLHKHINPEILPPEYGGTGPELNFKKYNQWLYDNSNKVHENLKHQRKPVDS